MLKKFVLIACLSFAAAFLVQHIFDEGNTKISGKNKFSPASKERKRTLSTELAIDDDMVAAILILPKSYLPVLKRFSQSKMAKNIKILQAQLKLDGSGVTAIHKTHHENERDRMIMSENLVPQNTKDAKIEHQPEKKRQIIAAGILYLMANAHKNKLY